MSLRNYSVLLLSALFLGGCDSSYHPYDGQSGFRFTPLAQDRYALAYFGRAHDRRQDVEIMWQHTARELCRGGSFRQLLDTHKETLTDPIQIRGGEQLPRYVSRYISEGEIHCLAPDFAAKRLQSDPELFGKHLATDQLVSGSAAHQRIPGK